MLVKCVVLLFAFYGSHYSRASLFSPIVTSLQIIDDGSASISCYTVCYTLKKSIKSFESSVVDIFFTSHYVWPNIMDDELMNDSQLIYF